MKPSEIYALPFELNNWPLGTLTDGWHNHLPEVGDTVYFDFYFDLPPNSPLQVRTHIDPYIDGERCCHIGSAWFDGKPVMIFRHAGRSGHDRYDRFITDTVGFDKMLQYIRSLMPGIEIENVVDPNKDLKELDEFYGDTMAWLIEDRSIPRYRFKLEATVDGKALIKQYFNHRVATVIESADHVVASFRAKIPAGYPHNGFQIDAIPSGNHLFTLWKEVFIGDKNRWVLEKEYPPEEKDDKVVP